MSDDIAKVKERLRRTVDDFTGAGVHLDYDDVQSIAADLDALLADHARLEALSVPVLWRLAPPSGGLLFVYEPPNGIALEWPCRAYALISTERVEP